MEPHGGRRLAGKRVSQMPHMKGLARTLLQAMRPGLTDSKRHLTESSGRRATMSGVREVPGAKSGA